MEISSEGDCSGIHEEKASRVTSCQIVRRGLDIVELKQRKILIENTNTYNAIIIYPMKFKFYEYEKCSTCTNARKWLDAKGYTYERLPIREQPPSRKELKQLLGFHEGNLKKLFNTSSKDYRDPSVKELLPNLSTDQALGLLTTRGNLNKRPILVGKDLILQGFKKDVWEKHLT